MVSSETLKTLTDDELAMLLFVVNNHKPRLLSYEIDRNILKSMHLRKLVEVLKKVEPDLLEHAKPIFSCLLEKLGIK